MILKRLILFIIPMIFLAACGFNEDKEKEESQNQLEDFFQLYPDKEELFEFDKSASKDDSLDFIRESLIDFFSTEFLESIEELPEIEFYGNSFSQTNLFFLTREVKGPIKNRINIAAWKSFKPVDSIIKKEDQTITFLSEDDRGKGIRIEMIHENNQWKINKAFKSYEN